MSLNLLGGEWREEGGKKENSKGNTGKGYEGKGIGKVRK